MLSLLCSAEPVGQRTFSGDAMGSQALMASQHKGLGANP